MRANDVLLTSVVVAPMCLLLLWEKTATLLNIKQALYVLGNMTVTLLARQFLTQPEETDVTEDDLLTNINNLTSRNNLTYQQSNPTVSAFIYWPFFIGFGFKLLIFIPFLILCIIPTPHEIQEKLTKSRNKEKGVGHTGGDSSKNKHKLRINNYYLVLGLLFSSTFLAGASQSSFLQYTFSTAVELNNGFNQKDAALLNIVISGVSFISLLFTGLAAYYIPIRILILTFAFTVILPDALLAFVGNKSSTMFWIFATFKALLITPNAPLLIPFIDSYIEIAGWVMAIYKSTGYIGSIIQYFINGYLLEYKSSWTLLVFGLALTVFLFITMFGAFLAARTGCKLKSHDESEEETLMQK